MEHLPLAERLSRMRGALSRKLSGFFRVTPEAEAAILSLCDSVARFAPGDVIVGQSAAYGDVYLLESGWVLRARMMETGARQIVNAAIPGDFVALNALLFTTSEFEHVARTFVTAFRIDRRRARAVLNGVPNLAAALFWANAYEESVLAERIVSLGRRNARTRAAHVLCEFLARLEIVEETSFPELALPISQHDFADILGISVVHMNTVLRALDREGVISFRKGVLIVYDRRRLERIAGFDDGYLHFTRRSDVLAEDG